MTVFLATHKAYFSFVQNSHRGVHSLQERVDITYNLPLLTRLGHIATLDRGLKESRIKPSPSAKDVESRPKHSSAVQIPAPIHLGHTLRLSSPAVLLNRVDRHGPARQLSHLSLVNYMINYEAAPRYNQLFLGVFSHTKVVQDAILGWHWRK